MIYKYAVACQFLVLSCIAISIRLLHRSDATSVCRFAEKNLLQNFARLG